MNEQDGTEVTTKRRKSRQTQKQSSKQPPAPPLPATDKGAWKAYWQEQGQPWRTEPEIDEERQKYLAEHRSLTPDIEKGIYPFKDIKLTRADVEWLLATHENGRGPVDWSDVNQRNRKGVDLRGADLRRVDLSDLPLARTLGSLKWDEWSDATQEQRSLAALLMEDADLSDAQLNRAFLREANLKRAKLFRTQLGEAYLRGADLEGADLSKAHLEGAYLIRAKLKRVKLQGAHLEGADLENVTLNDEKQIGPWLADTSWNGVNLAVVKWSQVKMLGEEYQARQKKYFENVNNKYAQLKDYEDAVRANRQLAVALRDQGLDEVADHFIYRAHLLQRVVWRRQRHLWRYFLSWSLYLLVGYGYRPMRGLFWYLAIILGFALAYHTFGYLSFWPPDAFVYSLTSFHGRGFFPGLEHKTSLHDPLIMLAAFEAVVGLFIEISFIATFTQRFFGR